MNKIVNFLILFIAISLMSLGFVLWFVFTIMDSLSFSNITLILFLFSLSIYSLVNFRINEDKMEELKNN